MALKLSINELRLIKELFKEKKEKKKRRKAKKKAKIFPNEKQKFNGVSVDNNAIRYNFPNSGASVLSRDFQNNLGDLNNRFNNLIKDKPEKVEEYKSKYHELADNLIDDVIDGKRNIRRNKTGSTTISDLIDEVKGPKKHRISRRKVDIVRSPRANDGAGDFSRASFNPRTQDENRPTMGGMISYFKTLPNEQPKIPQFMPRGDNIDFSVTSFEGSDAVDGMPDAFESGENPEFQQPEPDENYEIAEGNEEDDNAADEIAEDDAGEIAEDDADENDEDDADENDEIAEDDELPNSPLKQKPSPKVEDGGFRGFFEKRIRKNKKIMVIDSDDDDGSTIPNLKRSSSAPEVNKKNKSFVCSDCGKAYTTEKALMKHKKDKHKGG